MVSYSVSFVVKAFLQASGKIKKPGDRKKKRKREEGGRGEGERKETHSAKPSPSQQSQQPGGRGGGGGEGGIGKHQTVPDSVIDEFFEVRNANQKGCLRSPLPPSLPHRQTAPDQLLSKAHPHILTPHTLPPHILPPPHPSHQLPTVTF